MCDLKKIKKNRGTGVTRDVTWGDSVHHFSNEEKGPSAELKTISIKQTGRLRFIGQATVVCLYDCAQYCYCAYTRDGHET